MCTFLMQARISIIINLVTQFGGSYDSGECWYVTEIITSVEVAHSCSVHPTILFTGDI